MDKISLEYAIKRIKFEMAKGLEEKLGLIRVTAPLFVKSGSGINDNLNGVEKPISFVTKDGFQLEIVQSLAKWKRLRIKELKVGYPDSGIYTDMNAIRPDENLDNIHSIYVDQWDWERIIRKEDRNIKFLKGIVEDIYSVILNVEKVLEEKYGEAFSEIESILPKKIKFIYSETLLQKYPNLPPKERENLIAKKYGAVFIIGIGNKLSNDEVHDKRAPDYDDWSTLNKNGHYGLNGDIIVWNPTLQQAFELSSMGIRVDKESLLKQLEITNTLEERKNLFFHQKILNEELPLTIGGGIGQSRLSMFLLKKNHIKDVQISVWE